MDRKTGICILLILFIIFSFFFVPGYADAPIKNISSASALPEYVLDQYQEDHNEYSNLHSSIWIAQSFIPTMTPLTKVEIKIEKMTVIEAPLIISIRSNLTGSDLAYISIPANEIPYFSYWIECDFNDIEVAVNTTYYIVVRTPSFAGSSYHWFEAHNSTQDIYTQGEQWFSNTGGSSWSETSSDTYFIDATFRTYTYMSHVDLICAGFFNWTEVEPGQIVEGFFTVANNGTPLSYLNWEIYQWPSWGIWTFSQSSGTNVKPEDGPQTITVSVEAPHTNVPDTYTGKITIINSDDPEDYGVIQARMVTPYKKSVDQLCLLDILQHIISTHSLDFLEKTHPLQSFFH